MHGFLRFLMVVCIGLGLLLIVIDVFKDTIYNKVLVPQFNEPSFSIETDDILAYKWVLDARKAYEYDVSHVKNAVFASSGTINLVDKRDSVLVYCTVGKRSSDLVGELRQKGFDNVYNLKGGIINWGNNGHVLINKQNLTTDSIHTYSMLWSVFLKDGLVGVY